MISAHIQKKIYHLILSALLNYNMNCKRVNFVNLTVLQLFSPNNKDVTVVVLDQRADERHGNPPQGNQELLVVRDKVGRPPVSSG